MEENSSESMDGHSKEIKPLELLVIVLENHLLVVMMYLVKVQEQQKLINSPSIPDLESLSHSIRSTLGITNGFLSKLTEPKSGNNNSLL